MKCIYLFLVLGALSGRLAAQTPVDFEDVGLPSSGVWNGSDNSGSFRSGGMIFYNSYSADYDSWSGFACSDHRDTLTAGYDNQYSSIAGGGYGGSGHFAIAYDFGNLKIELEVPSTVAGMFLTNSTYAFLALRDGNAFAKKFGGSTGDDPDYFRVVISGMDVRGDTSGTVLFYLADFRAGDRKDDYIVRSWEWVDLTSLGEVASLRFSLESSDMGPYGMNTPGYFCIDNINDRQMPVRTPAVATVPRVFPNPFAGRFYITAGEAPQSVTLTDQTGRTWIPGVARSGDKTEITTPPGLSPGIYHLSFTTKNQRWSYTMVHLKYP